MRTGNPILNDNTFSSATITLDGRRMTLDGTINKTGTLLLLLLAGGAFTWSQFLKNPALAMPFALGGAVLGLIVCLVTCFKKSWAPVTAPLYAVCEGLFLGAFSALLNQRFPGIVIQAVVLTTGVLAALLFAYKSRMIRVTEKFKMGIFAATAAIGVVYLVNIVMGFFGHSIGFVHQSGWMGIGFSVVVVIIAAMNLLLDFDFIEDGISSGAPRYMEWFAGMTLMVTLVWLYIEILRLLSKLRSRD